MLKLRFPFLYTAVEDGHVHKTVLWRKNGSSNLFGRRAEGWRGSTQQSSPPEKKRMGGGAPTSTSYHHICKTLKKYGIFEVVNIVVFPGRGEVRVPSRGISLANLTREFGVFTGKSVNYVCFLYSYFKAVPRKLGSGKKRFFNAFRPLFGRFHLSRNAERCPENLALENDIANEMNSIGHFYGIVYFVIVRIEIPS